MSRSLEAGRSSALVILLCLYAGVSQGQNFADAGNGAPRGTAPTAQILPSEVLGADDLVEVMVSYCPELSRSFRVGADGTLALPLLHQRLVAAGLTPAQLTAKLETALVQENIMAEPTVNISVLEYRSRPVSVSGAVKAPLTFQATGSTTLLDAIAKAGGVGLDAGGMVLVTSKADTAAGKDKYLVQTIPMKALLSGANPALNLTLHGGEEIRIPEATKIFVAGDVRKPGMYPMQGDEDTTVVKAIALSQGLDNFSAPDAFIYRRAEAGGPRQEIRVPLNRIMSRKAPDVPLLADDILYVPTSNGKRMTSKVLNDLAGFGSTAASGMLIYK